MTDTCYKHSFEIATGVCRQCRNSYCAECLVYPRGEKKPPYCVTCALNAAGVRRKGAAMNPRLRKKGIFGRWEEVEEAPQRELGFYDVKIELPDEALNAPVMTHSARRQASADLQEVVAAQDEQRATTMPAPEPPRMPVAVEDDDPVAALDDWAATLTDSGDPTQTDPWPDSDSVDAWPDIGSKF